MVAAMIEPDKDRAVELAAKLFRDRDAAVSAPDRALLDQWLAWLEAQAELAYEKMYDARTSSDATACYSNAKGYLDDARALARRLQLMEAAARFDARLAHIKAVFRSQFS
jgi:hypothetical protein